MENDEFTENPWYGVVKGLVGGDELSDAHIKKIHRKFPVPSDFKIKWAVAESFGNHPSGIAVTDKGIVIKANEAAVKAVNESKRAAFEAENKLKDKKECKKYNPQKYIYSIIPWDLFDPEDFTVNISDGKVSVVYGDNRYSGFESKYIADFFNKCKTERRRLDMEAEQAATTGVVEINTTGLNDVVFAAGRGADQSSSGHGEFAEKASTILDNLAGERAQHVGGDNAKNGPDKVVMIDGKPCPVQSKFCKTASKSVNSCFSVDPVTGKKNVSLPNARQKTYDG